MPSHSLPGSRCGEWTTQDGAPGQVTWSWRPHAPWWMMSKLKVRGIEVSRVSEGMPQVPPPFLWGQKDQESWIEQPGVQQGRRIQGPVQEYCLSRNNTQPLAKVLIVLHYSTQSLSQGAHRRHWWSPLAYTIVCQVLTYVVKYLWSLPSGYW